MTSLLSCVDAQVPSFFGFDPARPQDYQGPNDTVRALTFSEDGDDFLLYVGGAFTRPGSHVGLWNGTKWSAVGDGTDGVVYALAMNQSNRVVYAAGDFSSPSSYIASWNGTEWSSLGNGTNGIVYALAISRNGTLFVGGGESFFL
jgi:transcriptional regulator of acetoin/glycerol metabolism